MAIIVSEGSGKTYTPHPEGQYAARCIDVVDMGWQKTDFGPKYKVRVVFYCGETEEREWEGETNQMPLTISCFFTASLHEKANLRGFLESWRGKSFTHEEAKAFDLEKMLGAVAFVQITHNNAANGKTYANVKSIMKLPKGMEAPDAPADFERVCERPDWEGPAPHPDMVSSTSQPDPSEPEVEDTTDYGADDDLPFAPLRLIEPLAPHGW